MPDSRFVATVAITDIAPGKYIRHIVEGHDLLIVRLPDGPYAIQNLCSHMKHELNRGRVMGGQISCPMHGGTFDIRTGCAVKFPAARPIRIFSARLVDGIVEIDVGTPDSKASAPS